MKGIKMRDGDVQDRDPPALLSLARQSVWAVSAQVSITLVGVITSVILNRTLGPEGRGAVGLVLLWPPLLAGLVSAGWLPALTSSMSRSPHNCRGYWTAAQLAGLATAGLACAVGWWLVPVVMKDSPELWGLTRFFLLHIPVALVALPTIAGLDALGRFDFSSRVRVGNPILVLAVLAPLVLVEALTPQSYCAIVLFTTVITTVYALYLLPKASKGSWRPQLDGMPGYVLRAAPLNWSHILQLRIDQLVIVLLVPLEPAVFGPYIVGTTLAGFILPIAEGLALVILPESARRSEASAMQLYTRMARLFLLGGIAFGLPVALAAPWVLWFFYGPQFTVAAYALRLGLLTVIFSGVFSMGLSTLQGAGRPGTATLIGIVSGLLSLAGSMILLPLLGYGGAALGQACGILCGLVLMSVVCREQGLSVFSLMPKPADVVFVWISLRRLASRNRRPAQAPPYIAALEENKQSAASVASDAIF